jgi:Ribonuclease G/E
VPFWAAGLGKTVGVDQSEAAAEIARQLRLRASEAFVIIDFFDMHRPENRSWSEKLQECSIATAPIPRVGDYSPGPGADDP